MPTIPAQISQARFIAARIVGGKSTGAPAPHLRRGFTLAKPVQRAELAVTACGLFDCELNGTRVNSEVFAPGGHVYQVRLPFLTFQVGHLLRQGDNAIGAILGDGWYVGHLGYLDRQLNDTDRPYLLLQLTVTYDDGSTQIVASDADWRASAGPILANDILMGEAHDARLDLGAWSSPGYDEGRGAWHPVIVGDDVARGVILDPVPGPPVRRIEELQPVSSRYVDLVHRKARIFDLGQNFAGRARIRARFPRGTDLRLRFGELLKPDGTLYVENLGAARATDSFTCAGTGEEVWEPRFTYHGFRYVEVSVYPRADWEEPDRLQVTGVVVHADLAPIGEFRCSHEPLNLLHACIRWGAKSNYMSFPTDCPQRSERGGWLGDGQFFARTGSFLFDTSLYFRKWMRDIRDSRPDGGTSGCVPAIAPSWGLTGDGGPAWADAAIIVPWTVHLCYGDTAILAENWECMDRYMAFVAARRCRGHIRSDPEADPDGGYGDWLAQDGSGQAKGGTPRDLIGTACYAYCAALMARMAAVLGREADAGRYRTLRSEITAAFNRRFVTPEGLVAGGTQTGYVLALHFGLLPEALRPRAVHELVRDIEAHGWHLTTGFVGTPYLLDALEEGGRLDVAYRLLEQTTFPSWLFMPMSGATTIWERWDAWTPERGFQDIAMNSFNHYGLGAVGAWMHRSLAGLDADPDEPAYRHIRFHPRPGGSVTWAEAALQTPLGRARIRWERDGAGMRAEITVPPGSRATFEPPAGLHCERTAFGPGDHVVLAQP